MTYLRPARQTPAVNHSPRAGSLLPYPEGWFCLGFSAHLRPGAVERVTFAGRESVLFRTTSGQLGLLDAYCPHLGAHLGRGGRVVDEAIRCPFHGFTFDVAGRCRSTDDDQPQSTRLVAGTRRVEERHGVIVAWHGSKPPEWHVPDASMDGWTAWSTRTLTIVGHPQETNENSVDVTHFAALHNYSEVTPLGELEIEGPRFSTRYQVRRRRRLGTITMDFTIVLHGLGHALVETHVPEIGMRARQLSLASPIDGQLIQLRLALSMHRSSPRRAHNLAAAITATRAGRWFAQRWALAAFAADVKQDVAIWQHKRYVHPPALVPGDGPIGRYRRWATQFYSTESRPGTSSEPDYR